MISIRRVSTAIIATAILMGAAVRRCDARTDTQAPAETDVSNQRPAILFVTPRGGDMSNDWVDWTWLGELHDAGFEVDVTTEGGLDELNWDRVRHFNVLFLYASPDALLRQWRGRSSDPAKVAAFQDVITRFAEAGGGIFLMPSTTNIRKQVLADATELMDARLPAEMIVEENPANRSYVAHSPLPIPLAWTAAVQESPVSAGVRGIWYPTKEAYVATQTNPLLLGKDWTSVLKTSPTARAIPISTLRGAPAEGYDIQDLDGLTYREEGERQPTIFGIREWKRGRVALCAMWRMFSVSNGTHWIFNRDVLSRGVRNRPSDFGRLLRNSFRWLAEPSLSAANSALGGYRTTPARLSPPNERPGAFEAFCEKFQVGKIDNKPAEGAPLFKGIIGARTSLTGGQGTVAEYAAAARAAGLDYLVFLEDLARLTPESWQAHSKECASLSGEDLLLLPGLSGRSNLGNFIFMFGQGLPMPPENVLRRDGKGGCVFYAQAQDRNGNFASRNTPLFTWVLDVAKRFQVGYGDFASSPRGMRMDQLRLCGMVAVDFYRDGQRVESLHEDYLTTAQGTIPPTPAAVNRLDSPDALRREAGAGRGLTYAQASSLDRIFAEALHYTCTYDGVNVFPSTGPLIEAWPANTRAFTFGAEEFVVEANVAHAPLRVSAEAGLKEVAIYDGRRLYRRFLPDGAKQFAVDLVLDRVVHKNLVAVATDMNGGKAISFRRGSWKSGSKSPEFCSDHINDMITISMARGPFAVPFVRPPGLPRSIGGWTWDGGPKALQALGAAVDAIPRLTSDAGSEYAKNMLQTPLLLAADELSMRVCSERRGECYGDNFRTVYNPWRTFGPAGGGQAKLFTCDLSYAAWTPPMIGVSKQGWGFGCERNGIVPAVWTASVTYRREQTIKRLELASVLGHPENMPSPAFVVSGNDPATSIDLAGLSARREIPLPTGAWLGVYSSRLMNAHLFFNRGANLVVELQPADPARKIRAGILFLADKNGTKVAAGQTDNFELGIVNFPISLDLRGPADLQTYVDYLAACPGLSLQTGTRRASAGTLTIAAENGVADLAIPQGDAPEMATVPLLVTELNPRWSASLFQREGYVKGYYGSGENRWRPLSVGEDGKAMVPLFVALAPTTSIVAGHPVVADEQGKNLFIQVTRTASTPPAWHVSVNNPTDETITSRLHQGISAPGLEFPAQTVKLKPGEYRVLRSK